MKRASKPTQKARSKQVSPSPTYQFRKPLAQELEESKGKDGEILVSNLLKNKGKLNLADRKKSSLQTPSESLGKVSEQAKAKVKPDYNNDDLTDVNKQ